MITSRNPFRTDTYPYRPIWTRSGPIRIHSGPRTGP